MLKVVVIGNLTVVIHALGVMRDFPNCDIRLVVSHPSLGGIGNFVQKWCHTHGIEHCSEEQVNSPRMVERIGAIAPDYIFSIYNPTILRPPLLAIPTKATINFHAGPLPSYRGMHTFSWAIINGEREYGVAWHLVDNGIDTGEVLFQRMFPISAGETALSLSQRSFDIGVDLFRERLGALLDGTLVPSGTPPGPSVCYRRADVPNGGLIDFSWPVERIDRFVRGLNYHPAPNPFVLATTHFSGRAFHPLKVVRIDRPGEPGRLGQVCGVEEHQIVVQAADGLVGITELLDDRRRKRRPGVLAEALGLKAGCVLGLG
ncbi:MAG: hypothetical protein JNL30_01880 [Rubrivivax sp.]|nr:hypothetical protein [Rubrivivax sp.]